MLFFKEPLPLKIDISSARILVHASVSIETDCQRVHYLPLSTVRWFIFLAG